MTVRAFALNAKTRAILTEIPFTSMSMTCRLNQAGSWSMTLPVSFTSPGGTEVLTTDNFDVNFSSVVFLRDSLPLFYGLIESEQGEIDEDSQSLAVAGPDFSLGYMKRKLYLPSTAYNTDQFTIAQGLVNQAVAFGTTISTTYEPSSTSGVVRVRNYFPAMRKYTYELLSELAAVENGFDFSTGVTGSQEVGFTPSIVFGYPRLFRRTGFTLATGKNISRVSYEKDGRTYANLAQVGGSDRGETTIPVTAQDASPLGTYLSFHHTESRPTVIEQATLLDHANRYLRLYPPSGASEYSFVVDTSDPDCQVGSFRVGDEFTVRVNKGRLNLDALMRVREWSLSVDEDGSEKLTMAMVPTENLS